MGDVCTVSGPDPEEIRTDIGARQTWTLGPNQARLRWSTPATSTARPNLHQQKQHQQHHQQHDHIFINKNNTKNTINSTKSSSTWPPALEALGPLPPVEPASSTLNAKSVSLAVLPVPLVETPTAKGALDVIVHRMGWWLRLKWCDDDYSGKIREELCCRCNTASRL